MDRLLQILLGTMLLMISISALLSIRAHYRVWRYSPPRERLPK